MGSLKPIDSLWAAIPFNRVKVHVTFPELHFLQLNSVFE